MSHPKYKVIHLILLLLLVLAGYNQLHAQYDTAQFNDGTQTTTEVITFINDNLEDEKNFPFDTTYHEITLNIHVVKSDFGNAGYIEDNLENGITNLKKYFKNIGLYFNVQPVDTIDNFQYSYLGNTDEVDELLLKHTEPNTLSLILVNEINGDNEPYGNRFGLTYYPNDTERNCIIIQKSHVHGTYITHLAGHYFGLLPTHETLGGHERVNGDNCETTGDYLCDTYPDHNLRNYVNDDCVYYDTIIKDINNEQIVPTVANIMSLSNDKCRCIFTNGQYLRMFFYLKNYRDYLK